MYIITQSGFPKVFIGFVPACSKQKQKKNLNPEKKTSKEIGLEVCFSQCPTEFWVESSFESMLVYFLELLSEPHAFMCADDFHDGNVG